MSSRKILFLVAHPHLRQSRANREITLAIESLPGVTTRKLYDLYPYFNIDVETEQRLLLEHDLLVVQHPLYWYSMPPLMKMWVDEVFESGWAYGPGGDRLKGKKFLVSVTAGAGAETFGPNGSHRFDVSTFLAPWDQTARLCGMEWIPHRVFHPSGRAGTDDVAEHAGRLRADLASYLETGRLS